MEDSKRISKNNKTAADRRPLKRKME